MRIGPHGYLRRFQATQSSATGFVGAYDAFASSLAHVYEPARRVLTSYTGDLVLLRRDSDDAELAFGYDADGNLDTAAIATWAGGASYVVTVYDQKGTYNITQATAGNQPLFTATAQNGHAGMTFDGSNDALLNANEITLPSPLGQSAALVLNPTITREYQTVLEASNLFRIINSTTSVNILHNLDFIAWADSGITSVLPSTGFDINASAMTIIDLSYDGNAANLATSYDGYTQGVQQSPALNAAGTGDLGRGTGIGIGARADGSGNWGGVLCSAILADVEWTLAQRTAIQTALNSYWATY